MFYCGRACVAELAQQENTTHTNSKETKELQQPAIKEHSAHYKRFVDPPNSLQQTKQTCFCSEENICQTTCKNIPIKKKKLTAKKHAQQTHNEKTQKHKLLKKKKHSKQHTITKTQRPQATAMIFRRESKFPKKRSCTSSKITSSPS